MGIKFDSKQVKAFFEATCKLGGNKKIIDTKLERHTLSEYLANNKDNMSVGDIAIFKAYAQESKDNEPEPTTTKTGGEKEPEKEMEPGKAEEPGKEGVPAKEEKPEEPGKEGAPAKGKKPVKPNKPTKPTKPKKPITKAPQMPFPEYSKNENPVQNISIEFPPSLKVHEHEPPVDIFRPKLPIFKGL